MRAAAVAALALLLAGEAAATPPANPSFAVCPDPAATPKRTRPNATDSTSDNYWWAGGNMHVLTTEGMGAWFTSAKPSYAALHDGSAMVTQSAPSMSGNCCGGGGPTFDFGGATPGSFTITLDMWGPPNPQPPVWQHVRHPWPSGSVVIAGTIVSFYHEEIGTCKHVPETKCDSLAECPAPPVTSGYRQCYWDALTGLPNPAPKQGYCFDKTAGRAGLQVSTDGGVSFTDRGRFVHPNLSPDNCTGLNPSNNTGWSGGIEFPMPIVDPDGYVYIFMSNLSGDPANLSATTATNQGILIARVSTSDILQADVASTSRIWFWDVTANAGLGGWTWNSQDGSSVANFRSHVRPLNYPKNTSSWFLPSGYGSAVGNFSSPQPLWSTRLGAYVLEAANFSANEGGSLPTGVFYFAGNALATDPLNWLNFPTYVDIKGVSKTVDPINGPNYLSSVLYDFVADSSQVCGGVGCGVQSCDYYYQLTGPNGANPGCTSAQGGGGTDGFETDKCIGSRADFFVRKNMSCAGDGTTLIVTSSSNKFLRFNPTAGAACNQVDPVASVYGGRGRGR